MANLARGFQRLAWVVSLVIGFALVGLGLLIAPENSYLFVGAGVGAFLFTWAVFFTCRWVVAGFRNDPARRRAADATSKADRKKCPRCGFENGPESQRCGCGHNFDNLSADKRRSEISTKPRANWIWPRIVDEASAETAAKEAVGYAIVVAIITAAIATASVFYGRPVGGFDAWNYLDAALVGGIAFGLWKRSRFAAVAGVVYWMISAAVKLADGQRFGIVTLLILLGFIHGIRGTFALAKYRKAVDTVGHHSR